MNLYYPVKKIHITQGWGLNPDIYSRFGLKGHNGIDFRAFLPNGDRCYEVGKSEVFSPHEGIVLECSFDASGYGYYVKIENENEGSILAHLSALPLLKLGQQVKAGAFIGFQGSTGFSTGIHLHWGYYTKPRNRANGYSGTIDQEKLSLKQLSELGAQPEKEDMTDLLKKYGAKTTQELDELIFKHVGLSWGKEDDLDNKSMLAEDRRKNTRLSIQVKDLKTEIGLLVQEIDTLVTDISTLNKQVSAHKGEVTKKEKAIVELEKQLVEAKDQLVEAQKPTIIDRFTSRKWIGAIIAVTIPILNKALGLELDQEVVMTAVLPLIAFIGVEGFADFKLRAASQSLKKIDDSQDIVKP